MKVLTVLGARPQFIKAAAVSRVFSEHDGLQEIIVHTGQHFDQNMSDVFFDEMNIPKPDYLLSINSLGHGAMTGRMLEEIEKIILKEEPDFVMVYGDTNSTIAGALAAKKLHVKVVHVEAGLRSFNIQMPEEVNRILTDRISDILFCPTGTAINNLNKEGYENIDTKIVKNGDVMQDAAIFYAKQADEKSTIVADLGLEKDNYVLVTSHRAENTDDQQKMTDIVNALNEINKKCNVVLPLHPRTKKYVEKYGLKLDVTIIDPVGYFDMIQLISNSKIVMTDSGGLQKEAFFFEKLCITMREQTEWVELCEHGFNTIVGSDYNKILEAFDNTINQTKSFDIDLYGKGKASKVILDELLAFKA